MARFVRRQPQEQPLWYASPHYPFMTLGQLDKLGRLTLGRERSYIDDGKVRTLIDARLQATNSDVTVVLWERGPIRLFLAHWRATGRPPWSVLVERAEGPSASLSLRRVS